MNIDSAVFSSLLPAHLATEGVSPPLADHELPAGFIEAFMEQLKLLSAGNNQSELLKPSQTITNSSRLNELQGLADLLGGGGEQLKLLSTGNNQGELQSLADLLGGEGNMQKLAAFFGQELPAAYQLTDDIDPDATLPALTDTRKFVNTNEIQGVGADKQNINETAATDLKVIQTDNLPDAVEIMAAIEEQNILPVNESPVTEETSFIADNKEVKLKNNGDNRGYEQTGELAAALLISMIAPVTASAGQNNESGNSADLTVIKQQSSSRLMKNSSQNNGLASTIVDSDEGLDDFLQKQAKEPHSEQSMPAFNLNYFEKAERADKNGQIDREFALGGEKNLLRGGTDMGQLNRHTIDIRAEVPPLTKPVTHPGWNKELGERIVWMNNRSIPAAEIKLNPQHLGPISVRIDVNQDQATILFAAQHSTVRDALEASIPRLRDMMSAQQLNLTDVNVAQHFSSDQGRPQPQNFAQTAASPGQDVADISIEAMDGLDDGRAVMTKGLLSIYA